MKNREILEPVSFIASTNSLYQDFTSAKAYLRRGQKKQDDKTNFLTIEQRVELIHDIYTRCYSVKVDGKKEILLDLGNGSVQYIERNYSNFETLVKMTFRDITDHDGFESIFLDKLFELIKSKKTYTFRKTYSLFFKRNELVINDDKEELVLQVKQTHDFRVNELDKKVYKEIVNGISAHWLGNIPTILDHLAAGMYVTDKKSVWMLILASSNFGKSKLFKWVEEIGISSMVEYKDLIGSGITDISTDKVESKLCLVVDEVLTFHRNLFKIEDYLPMRPMRQHTVNIGINSRYLLSADGGTFNNDYMDKQIMNRVCVMDLRKEYTGSLGDLPVTKKHGKYKIHLVMKHYIYKEVKKRIAKYEALNHIDRANLADKTMEEIFDKFKQTKKDFFEIVSQYLYEILESPRDALEDSVASDLYSALIVDDVKGGWIIKRPATMVKKILKNYSETLSYELEFKELQQIVDSIKGASVGSFAVHEESVDGSSRSVTHRGLFIPFPKSRKQIVPVIVEDEKGKVVEQKQLEIDYAN